MVDGYNIGLKINDKVIAARTKDDLSVSAVTKESITKDDAGTKNIAVKSHDITFTVEALLTLNSTSTTSLDRDDVLGLALATGSSAVIPFSYACDPSGTNAGKTLSGNCIITSYSESSSASTDEDSTISLSCQTTGAVTFADAS